MRNFVRTMTGSDHSCTWPLVVGSGGKFEIAAHFNMIFKTDQGKPA